MDTDSQHRITSNIFVYPMLTANIDIYLIWLSPFNSIRYHGNSDQFTATVTMACFNMFFQLSLLVLSVWLGTSGASDLAGASSSKMALGTLPLQRIHVHVNNQIKDKNLFLHCHSNDDLHEQKIPFGGTYLINFKVDFFGTSSFKCNMWWYADRRTKKWHNDMLIYDYNRDQNACGHNNCDWVAKSDGVHFEGLYPSQKVTYAWNQSSHGLHQ